MYVCIDRHWTNRIALCIARGRAKTNYNSHCRDEKNYSILTITAFHS